MSNKKDDISDLPYPEKRLRDATEIERALAQYDAIEYLRDGDGDRVTIYCQNPESNGNDCPNEAIEVCGFWTDWKEKTYRANTVLEALQQAIAAKKKFMEEFHKQANDEKSSCA